MPIHRTLHLLARLSPETQVGVAAFVERLALLKNWDQFLDARGLSTNTRRQYRYWMLRFVADTCLPPDLASEDDVAAYLSEFPAKGQARGQIIRALQSFYTYAQDCGQVGHNPVKRIQAKHKKYGPAPFLKEDELIRLLIAATLREERRAWAILFLYSTGARLQSACHVTEEDCRAGWVRFRVTKGDNPYSVPISSLCQASIDGLKESPRPPRSGPNKRGTLIGVGPTSLWAWVARAAQDSGVYAHPHLLRHTFATHVVERSPATDIRVVAELLGHADLGSVHRYVGVRDERKKAAVEVLG